MEKMNIFQKDGKNVYILKGWKIKLNLTKDLKTQKVIKDAYIPKGWKT